MALPEQRETKREKDSTPASALIERKIEIEYVATVTEKQEKKKGERVEISRGTHTWENRIIFCIMLGLSLGHYITHWHRTAIVELSLFCLSRPLSLSLFLLSVDHFPRRAFRFALKARFTRARAKKIHAAAATVRL